MLSFLAEQQMLRVTTLRIKGQRAAVNVGAVYHNRKKVDQDFPEKLIHTIRGVGFVLQENEP